MYLCTSGMCCILAASSEHPGHLHCLPSTLGLYGRGRGGALSSPFIFPCIYAVLGPMQVTAPWHPASSCSWVAAVVARSSMAKPTLRAASLQPLICITEPLFALINVSAKCLMCEISSLLAGIGRAIWESHLLCSPGRGTPHEPLLVLLSFWLAASKGLGLSSWTCSCSQKL